MRYIILILTLCVAAGCTTKKGEVSHMVIDWSRFVGKLDQSVSSENQLITKSIRKSFISGYKKVVDNRAFAQSNSGAWAYKSGFRDPSMAMEAALGSCELANRGFRNTMPCKIVNVNGVWGAELIKLDK